MAEACAEWTIVAARYIGAPNRAKEFEPKPLSTSYDPELRDPATKEGVVFGMAMTEEQGGSDVRANTTTATPNADGTWSLTGHKWFCSAPQSDAFLVLAQATGIPGARAASWYRVSFRAASGTCSPSND